LLTSHIIEGHAKTVVIPGFADQVELAGYLIERCPDCHQTGPFAIYDAKRKFTMWLVPMATIGKRHIMECRTCGARFSLPEDLQAELPNRLLSQEQLSARVRESRSGRSIGAPAQQRNSTTAYEVLQVDPRADQDVIEAAFKRLALKYHPDRSTDPGAADRMRELIEARKILIDPPRRRAYDASLGVRRASARLEPMPFRATAVRPEEV
jgi:hypothetical protein